MSLAKRIKTIGSINHYRFYQLLRELVKFSGSNPTFHHSRVVIDDFAVDQANSGHTNLALGQKQIRFSIVKCAVDEAVK
ncbi:hypothetical protein N7517_009839 [Penicillium concentricum]|uniref:Uncharacterized protein n=1 Tax=Penicillium concentricum TaxID=293559 RepID=A0A9W9RI09_9EURO|nr:uncharacterized protein N7517_009839 [Penicillium concentricum]KAJ5360648.1 hypothetical protein N7517_009839 [Penicillium concentricum]